MRRRSSAKTRKTYRILKRMIGTVKKSTETKSLKWFSRNVRHVCEGGLSAPHHGLADGGLPDVDAWLEQLAADPRGPSRTKPVIATPTTGGLLTSADLSLGRVRDERCSTKLVAECQ